MDASEEVVEILEKLLNLKSRFGRLRLDAPLLGAVPELDSMAAVTILTTLEEHFGFVVEDDEVDGAVFETVASLVEYVERKMAI